MSYFPFIEDIETKESNIDLPLYTEIAWGFDKNIPIIENGEFKKVTGNEAIKVWCYKAILTSRYNYPIYSWDYGTELIELIGKAYSKELTKVEAKRYIQEALLINPYIKNVDVNEIDFKGDKLSVAAQIETIYGVSEVII